MSGEKKQEYLCDGLAEGIIDSLSKSEHLFVIARNSTFTYKGKAVKMKQVAEEMGVRYVIEGSVQGVGNRVRITVQLIDALTGGHLFSERYDRDLKDSLSLQDEIALKVLNAVQVKLTVGEGDRLNRAETINLEAYLRVMQAREYLGGTRNKERLERARQLFEEAIALDPLYSVAYSGLAQVHTSLVGIGASESPFESVKQALELNKKALALDDSNSVTHVGLAFSYVFMGNFNKGLSEAQKAVSLNPNSARAYHVLGWTLNFLGRHQEAIPYLQKSLRLSPIPIASNVMEALALSYMRLGRYEDSIATLKKELQIFGPDTLLAHIYLIRTYMKMGLEKEARNEGMEVLRIDPNFKIDRYVRGNFRDDHLVDELQKAGLK